MLRKNGSGLLLSLVLVLCVPSFAFSDFSEGYYMGTGPRIMSMSRDVTEFNGAGRTEGVSVSRFSSDSSLAEMESGGYFFRSAAAGYFFRRLPWLGVEVNYSIKNPSAHAAIDATIENNPDGIWEDLSFSNPKGVVDIGHYSTAGFLFKFRPPKDSTNAGFGVFGGLGFGVDILGVKRVEFLDVGQIKRRDEDRRIILDVDFLLSAGIDYKIMKNARAYGEYRYKNASFGSTAFGGGIDYKFKLEESSVTFGFACSF